MYVDAVPSWTNATPANTPPGVILRPQALDRHVERRMGEPSPALADVVERYWSLRWNLGSAVSLPSSLVPQFSVNLTWEVGTDRVDGATVVTGVPSHRFDARLFGSGGVVGVKFRPGAFTGLTDVPAGTLTDQTVPADSVLPGDLVAAFREAALDERPGQLDLIEASLLPLLPASDDGWRVAATAIELARRPDVVSVDILAHATGRAPRTLQRLFRHYIGLPPKQVITRLRLHDAVTELDAGAAGSLADLAVRLGFFDQAHFTREFTRFVGVSPSRYPGGLSFDVELCRVDRAQLHTENRRPGFTSRSGAAMTAWRA